LSRTGVLDVRVNTYALPFRPRRWSGLIEKLLGMRRYKYGERHPRHGSNRFVGPNGIRYVRRFGSERGNARSLPSTLPARRP